MNRRPAVLCAAIVCAVWGASRARAEPPPSGSAAGSATPLPLAVDLKKVPVGSWAEYQITDGQNTMSVRMALVARSAKSANIETQIQGGPVTALGRATVRMSLPLDADAEIRPREQVIQIGDNEPMMLPGNAAGGAQMFKKLDAQKRVGVDDVKVPGGSFSRAEHYQDKGAGGERIDFWISKKVLPFGLIKVASTAQGSSTSVGMELTRYGGGQKATITKEPRPFDPAAMMKEAQAPAPGAATGDSGGVPLRPIPSPHPGMPPTPFGATPHSGSAKATAKTGKVTGHATGKAADKPDSAGKSEKNPNTSTETPGASAR